MLQKNKDLKKFYNNVYKSGEKKHYTKILFEDNELPIEERVVLGEVNWKNKTVLDIGCGTGLLCHEIAKRGAKKVVGIDFSTEAIEEAKKAHQHTALEYLNEDAKDHKGEYDIIVSLGTLEHMDDPFKALKLFKKFLKPKGKMVLTCPNWTNPRGYILLTLEKLFNAPITLVDLHYLTPIEFEGWANKLDMKLDWRTFDYDWAHGERLIKDLTKRLPNVLRDANLPKKEKNIKNLIDWVQGHILPLDHKTKFSGALGLYILKK